MELIKEIERGISSKRIPDIRPGDTVRVHWKIREGGKERTQPFEGLVIRRRGGDGTAASITVRRIASGVGVERTFPLHSPQISRIQVLKRTKVRRAYLTYMRGRTGRAARLQEKRFDRVDMTMEEATPAAESAGPQALEEPEGSPELPPEEGGKTGPAGPEIPETAPPKEGAERQAADESAVAETEATEVEPETQVEPEVDESTEEVAAEETAAADNDAEAENRDQDESEAARDAAEAGVDEAGDEDESPAQKEGLA